MAHWRPWFPIVLWAILLVGLIVRYRSGKWRRPHTFKWAIILMSLAIVLSVTAAVLQVYGK
jgi:hypothetical protein